MGARGDLTMWEVLSAHGCELIGNLPQWYPSRAHHFWWNRVLGSRGPYRNRIRAQSHRRSHTPSDIGVIYNQQGSHDVDFM